MNILKKFLSKIIIAVFAVFVASGAWGATSNLTAGTDVGMANIGDFGSWTTENNRQRFLSSLTYDFNQMYTQTKEQLVENYVPIEAKVGLAFMNAFSFVADVLDKSLVRFVIIFIIIAYGFWTAFEAYTIIRGDSNAKEKLIEIAKKGLQVAIWTSVLTIGPAKLFMMAISPIMFLGTYIADIILDAVSTTAGVSLPDTCQAIHEYATLHISKNNLLDPASAANIMCVPTRLSGFCYTAISAGWGWITQGIGKSTFTFLTGIGFVTGFIYLAWKFAFVAFGVIADLFLGIIMLPFTAIAETVGKTSYKGIAGNIFNGFIKLFSAESLKVQIERFINAALYFVSMSIIIAVCTALLSTIITVDMANNTPTLNNNSVWIIVLISALTWWIAKTANERAQDWGGRISHELGSNLQKDLYQMYSSSKDTVSKWYKAIKEATKKK